MIQGRTDWFLRSKPISIKEVRSFNYKKDKRFTKIARNIFHLTNNSIDVNRPNAHPRYHRYYKQVTLLFTECRLGLFHLKLPNQIRYLSLKILDLNLIVCILRS